MEQTKKKGLLIKLLFFIISLAPLMVLAQDPGDPGGDPDAPIDGGLILLIAIGILYGLKRIKTAKRQNERHTLIG